MIDPLGPAQAVALVDEIISSLRHELRNKFAAVRSAGFYIRRRLQSAEAWQADTRLDELSTIIQEEMRVANELLDPSQVLRHAYERRVAEVDAAECVRYAVECTRTQPGRSVAIKIDAHPGELTADRTELALSVRSLLENAVEASPADGAIEVRAFREGRRYFIEVEDAGPGMSAAQRESALRAFYSSKEGHIGLGLNIARRIAERYNGGLYLREREAQSVVALEFNVP